MVVEDDRAEDASATNAEDESEFDIWCVVVYGNVDVMKWMIDVDEGCVNVLDGLGFCVL